MNKLDQNPGGAAAPLASAPQRVQWNDLAERVLAGHVLAFDEGLAMLRAPDDDLLDLLAAAYRIRRRYFGNRVQLHFLINAKSGLCPEDCGYCSQSKVSRAAIEKYNLVDPQTLLDGARAAAQRKARTYCMVISARGPNEREMRVVEEVVPQIKARYPLRVCTSLGLLTEAQAQRLKACGVDRVNHNVNTGSAYYREICSTHTYEDRLATLRAVRAAGLEVCCGGIVGMGERDADVVQMALELQAIEAESIPVNFLIPIEGTPLAGAGRLHPRYCLKVLAMCRFANPRSEIRMAAGREIHLRSMQAMGLYAANSLFVGDYLTTKGQPPEDDFRMIEDLGFTIVPADDGSPGG